MTTYSDSSVLKKSNINEYWDDKLGPPKTITYTFLDYAAYGVPDYYDDLNLGNDFYPSLTVELSTAQQVKVSEILSSSVWGTSFSDVLLVNFTNVAHVGDSLGNSGDITLSKSTRDAAPPDTRAITYFGDDAGSVLGTGGLDKSAIILDDNKNELDNLDKGEVGYYTLQHELGHSLGLEDTENIPSILNGSLDSQKYTMMSYKDFNGIYATGLQLLDIAALQDQYGRNYSKRQDATTYSYSNVLYDSSQDNGSVLYTIWDGGGLDKIDASDFSQRVQIDLRQGRFSSIGKYHNGNDVLFDGVGLETDPNNNDHGNVAISYYSIIENATGTNDSLGDILIGNAWDNTLIGGGGDDKLYGDGVVYDGDEGFHEVDAQRAWGSEQVAPDNNDSGNDHLTGGEGNDLLSGGAGTDTAHYEMDLGTKSNNLTIHFGSFDNGVEFEVTDGYGNTDSLISIEEIVSHSGASNTIKLDNPGLFKKLNLIDDTYQYNGKQIEIPAVNKIVANAADNEFEFYVPSGLTIDGGGGNDTATYVYTPLIYDMKNGYVGAQDQTTTSRDHLINVKNVSISGGTILADENKDMDLVSGSNSELRYNYSSATQKAVFDLNAYYDDDVYMLSFEYWRDYAASLYGSVNIGGHEHTGSLGALFESRPVSEWTPNLLGYIVLTGTNYGDDYYIDGSLNRGWIESGYGNDTVVFENGAIDYVYTKGNDHIYNARQDSVTLGYDIRFSDLSFSVGFAGNDAGWDYYNLTITVANHGVLTLHEIPFLETDDFSYALGLGSLIVTVNQSGTGTLSGTETVSPIIAGSWGVDNWTGRNDLNETFNGNGGDDILSGGGGTDTLNGGWGNDTLNGGDGNDTLSGGLDNDALSGNAGNDTLSGGDGNDTYYYAPSSEFSTHTDTIVEGQYQGDDTIRITGGLTKADFSLAIGTDGSFTISRTTNPNSKLVINGILGENGEILTGNAVERIIFDNNSVWNLNEGLTLAGTSGNDTLKGSLSADTFTGSAGTDTLKGFAGDDMFSSGLSVSSTIDGGDGTDTVSYALSASAINADLEDSSSSDPDDGDSSNSVGHDTLESIENIYGSAFNDTIKGSSGNNIIRGGAGSDNLDGMDGIDTLDYSDSTAAITSYLTFGLVVTGTLMSPTSQDNIDNFENIIGSGFNDSLNLDDGDNYAQGGSGNDTILGYNGNDILEGGIGNDNLQGGNDNDTYIYLSGLDSITETGGVDTLKFNASISLEDLTFTNLATTSLQISAPGSQNAVTLSQQRGTNAALLVENLSFDDGFTIDLSKYNSWLSASGTFNGDNNNASGVDLTDIILGSSSTDTIHGYDLDDTIHGRAGNDSIYGDSGADLLHGGDGNDTVNGGEGNDALWGGDGNDTLTGGSSGDDTASGGLGNDTYTYDSGLDTYSEKSAEGTDHLIMAAAYIVDQISFEEAEGTGFRIVAGAGNEITLTQNEIETIEFAEGFTLSLTNWQDWIFASTGGSSIIGGASNDTMIGRSGVDTITAGEGNDFLYGGSGNDTIQGDAGNDTIRGGHGNDTYIYSSGIDTLSDTDGTDTIELDGDWVFGDITFEDVGTSDLKIILNAGEDEILLLNQRGSDAALKFETLRFADNTTYSLIGNNTYNYTSGIQTISDTGGNDILYMGAGIKLENISFSSSGTVDLKIITSAGVDETTILNQRGSDPALKIETLVLDDGFTLDLASYTSWISTSSGTKHGDNNNASGVNLSDTILGSSSSNYIYGQDLDDTIHGRGGADAINGGEGNDRLHGGDGNDDVLGGNGNDVLWGGSGHDDLQGGAGNDIIYGGTGNDVFLYEGGMDTNWETHTDSVLDTIKLGSTFTIDQMSIRAETVGYSIVFSTGVNEIYVPDAKIEKLEFAPGAQVSLVNWQAWLFASSGGSTVTGTSGEDYILGSSGNDILYGGGANDFIHGGAGNDTIYGEGGYDTLYGGEGNDTIYAGLGGDSLSGGAGDDILIGAEAVDYLYGGTGADTFKLLEIGVSDYTFDHFNDFNLSQGDKLDISDLLFGYDPLTDLITDFVEIVDFTTNSGIRVDQDGTGTAYSFVHTATITGVTGLTDEAALVNNGTLIVS